MPRPTGYKHSPETIAKLTGQKRTQDQLAVLSLRAKETHKNPQPTPIVTEDTCDYGCGQVAVFKFKNGKLCCSESYNSCPKKRKDFSNLLDHAGRAERSLKTRTELGITKTSQIKGGKTRVESGFYNRLSEIMKQKWIDSPWNPNLQCPLLKYKDTTLVYQGSHEFEFLVNLEMEHDLYWIKENVKRGPSVWYIDPHDGTTRLYISDFIIGKTIYEIKSQWTWNKYGTDLDLENRNMAKFDACSKLGYSVILVIDGKLVRYGNDSEWTLGGAV